MQNEIKSIFEKSLNEGDFSSSQKNIKEKSFNRFIEQGFPNKRIEDWKFSDLNQIISANFENLDFSKKNIDKSVDVDFINEFEHRLSELLPDNVSKRDLTLLFLTSLISAIQNGEDLEDLIQSIKSKGGTTEAAIKLFEDKDFMKIVRDAIQKATKRSLEMSK